MLISSLALIIGANAMSVNAVAQDKPSLKEQRARVKEEKALRSEADYTSTICAVDLRVTINWETTPSWPKNKSIAEACNGALSAMEALCRSGKQAAVSENIKGFQCLGNGSGPTLSGKVLSYGAVPSGWAFDETRAYLNRMIK